jgi:type I restriction enzyme R subunit
MTDSDAHTAECGFRFDEKYLSQIPALQVLINLGYQYLTPAEALAGGWRQLLAEGDDEHV